MRAKVLNDGPERTVALIFDTSDEPVDLIRATVRRLAGTCSTPVSGRRWK